MSRFVESSLQYVQIDDPIDDSDRWSVQELIATGLAVVADDTGRVLMIQRPLKDGDPNGGKWEFPGGRIEEGEQPLEAAMREWQEEVGLTLPPPEKSPSRWESSDGKYVGFVLYMHDGEASLDINDRDLFSDPDSEVGGVIAWVHPRDLPQHNLRPALLSDVDEVVERVTKWLLTRQVRKSLRWSRDSSTRGPVVMVPASAVEGYHDFGYSQTSSDSWAAKLAEAIKRSERVTALTVVETSPGRYRVIDGKHRLQALGMIGGIGQIGVQVSNSKSDRRRKSGPVNRLKSSYFEECERDDEGHCLPSGEGGGAPEDDDDEEDYDDEDVFEPAEKDIGSTVQSAGRWLADKWTALEGRYGRKAALAMAVAMIGTLPVPGNIAGVIAVAEGIRGISGYFQRECGSEVVKLKGCCVIPKNRLQKTAVAKSSPDQVLAAMNQIGNGADKFTALSALGQRLGGSPESLHAAVMQLWRQGKITVARYEGRMGGASAEERRWWLDAQGETLAYVMLRR